MRRLHSGQSSILLLALLASLVAAGAAAFGSGQLVNDKMRLVNAADAAAYSAERDGASGLSGFLQQIEVSGWVAASYFYNLASPRDQTMGIQNSVPSSNTASPSSTARRSVINATM